MLVCACVCVGILCYTTHTHVNEILPTNYMCVGWVCVCACMCASVNACTQICQMNPDAFDIGDINTEQFSGDPMNGTLSITYQAPDER